MIAKLTGRLDSSGAGHAVIDVGGVGYLVEASARTLDALGPVGGDVTIHTEMLVGEDFLRLLGFAKGEERDWFRLLTSVQGVGAKVALAILSALEIGDLQRALASGDSAMIARANGVGPKLAQRIAHELKDKAGTLGGISGGGSSYISTAPGPLADAVTALTGLGFKPGEASAAVAAASEELGVDASLDALVRVALKKAAK
ncbi:MAG: Holliday junction branch migration protein RuvA [Sphingopyxis sp.]|jgi:Holliday junction DNA helicase RuvA|uniref:Holliday junction branch migration protein RuvA n=1 Tax=Sphingopyxis sp. TaxID=1908224 RepID=UPI003F711070